ncbi:MAG: hypothetical protein QOJ67_3823 [Acidimicrobiaceae bacterium]
MKHAERRAAGAALAIVVVAFGAIYVRRVTGGVSNVDDYLYALQSKAYLTGLGEGPRGLISSWRSFSTNSPLVPMAATPIAVFSSHPNVLVLVQLVALIGLLIACWALLSQLGCARSGTWAAAAVVVCIPPVLTYGGMLHFALAASACCVGALAAYLASDRLRLLRPTLLFGLVLGLLGISRVIAPVYVAALLAPVAVDLLSDRQDVSLRLKRLAFAGGAALIVAGPWWLLNGRSAIQYLRGLGYDSSSGFAEKQSPLELLQGRLTHTADETGWLLAAAILVLVVVATFQALRVRNRPVLLSIAVAVLGILALATSSNSGTAFALPFVAVAACVAASVVTRGPRPMLIVAVVLVATLVLPSSSLGGRRHPLWLSGTPAEMQAQGALGCDCVVDTDVLNREVLDHVVGRTLVVRDDAVVNLNVMGFLREDVVLLTPPYGARSVSSALLASVETVVTGSTAAPYHSAIDFKNLDPELRSAGFTLLWERRLSPANDVVVWHR